ncbi:MAG: hypothetical protein ACT4QF_00190 [Sporichthyaceae bacterium]|jgi:hypothetical protein
MRRRSGEAAGEWIDVELSDGSMRRDWIPVDQPPPPGGYPGLWHVVAEPDGSTRWEWHLLRAALPGPSGPDLVGAEPMPTRRSVPLGMALLALPGAVAVVSGAMLVNELFAR